MLSVLDLGGEKEVDKSDQRRSASGMAVCFRVVVREHNKLRLYTKAEANTGIMYNNNEYSKIISFCASA